MTAESFLVFWESKEWANLPQAKSSLSGTKTEGGNILWGGEDTATDYLFGGAGADTFLISKYNGNDAVYNSDYADNVVHGMAAGQMDLFGDTDEKTFAEYKYVVQPDISRIEKLNMEKELIGIFLSGHPLDDYKKAFEKANLNSQNIARIAAAEKAERKKQQESGASWEEMRSVEKTYVAVGLLAELREFTTKTGKVMAFGKLRDYNGEFDLTFFERTWQNVKDSLKVETVYAFQGKVDSNPTRESKALLVEEVLDPEKLEERAIQEIHVQLEPNLKNDNVFFYLKEFLFGNSGKCEIFFHIDDGGKTYIVRAGAQITAPANKEFLEKLKSVPLVRDVWTI